ncbi:MAG: hypothetical protein M3548_12725 [Actinomycetota bacterium]|nr:hypothetical protein [Actinomycetota bacterium]
MVYLPVAFVTCAAGTTGPDGLTASGYPYNSRTRSRPATSRHPGQLAGTWEAEVIE